jgi:hypothetical protein
MLCKTAHVRLFLISIFLLWSCEPRDLARSEEAVFFDINGLLDGHILLLDSLNPVLHKIAFLGSRADTTIFRPDSAGWARELDIFKELDLNRPVLRDKYSQTLEHNANSGKKTIHYTPVESINSGVKYLRISFMEGEIFQVEGEFQQRSLLYDASRKLTIDFDPFRNGSTIISYSIIGRQKIILQDTIFYQVQSDLIY